MIMTDAQLALGTGMIKLAKKHIKAHTTPTQEELMKVARSVDPQVKDPKKAAQLLMSQGMSTLSASGALPDTDVKGVIDKINNQLPNFDNFGDFATAVINNMPNIPPEAKLAAAALIGD